MNNCERRGGAGCVREISETDHGDVQLIHARIKSAFRCLINELSIASLNAGRSHLLIDAICVVASSYRKLMGQDLRGVLW